MHHLIAAALLALVAAPLAACDDSCIDGCPAAGALATCTATAGTSVDALLADPTPSVGQRVVVSGVLGEETAVCTQLGCFDGCCNSCGARLTVAGASAALPIASSTRDLVCGGDESRVCCPLARGAAVLVQGTLMKEADTLDGPTFVLTDAEPCAPR